MKDFSRLSIASVVINSRHQWVLKKLKLGLAKRLEARRNGGLSIRAEAPSVPEIKQTQH